MRRFRLFLFVVIPFTLLGVDTPGSAEPDSTLPKTATQKVDYATEIQPILRKNCYSCHGADEQESGLRLDIKKRAWEGGDGGTVIVPGKSDQSRLIQLVAGLDEEVGLMPPKGQGVPLTADQIGLLRAWIDQGAEWPDDSALAKNDAKHWSFQPIARRALPGVANSLWPRNPIDAFILSRLEKEHVAPSPRAAATTLLRRLSLDLLGLPPNPDEIAAFLQDDGPDAYERLIDRLLASPHYGERWGRHWLDLARYADSDGYEKDKARPFAWRFRNWVIDAINADQPYDQFTLDQLAGDLIPKASIAQKVAVGFHRHTLHNTEGGIDPEEDRVKKTVDRTNTLGAVWLGLTIGCAQCHSHKYDPLSQREYYSLYAFFNSLNETDVDAPSSEDLTRVAIQKGAHSRERARLQAAVSEYENTKLPAAQAQWEAHAATAVTWTPLEIVKATSAKGATFKTLDDQSWLATGKNVLSDVYTIDARSSLTPITAIRLEVLPDKSLTNGGPGRANNGNFVLTTFRVAVVSESGEATAAKLQRAHADFAQNEWGVHLAINDNSVDGWAVSPQFGKRHIAVFETQEPLTSSGSTRLSITLDQTYDRTEPHNIGRFRLSATNAPPPVPLEGLPADVAAMLTIPPDQRTAEQKAKLSTYYRTIDPELVKLQAKVSDHAAHEPKLPADLKAQSVTEAAPRRETRIQIRGDFLSPGDVVPISTPAVLPALTPRAAQPDRIDLVRWLFDRENPLTARVAVNRMWQHSFGRGLVLTSDDFGRQGELPSHLELLDWLAADFAGFDEPAPVGVPVGETGTDPSAWSMKRLHRMILTSATYRQASDPRADLAATDPENALVARQIRRRVESEIIRDLALSVSGLLDSRIGGPSVRPKQPTDYASITYAGSASWPVSKGSDAYRRGLYTFFQRTSPYPMLATFDSPDSIECCVRRLPSNTPLQSLTMWNDPVVFEAAQSLGRRIVRDAKPVETEDPIRVYAQFAFEVCLGRAPSDRELDATLALYKSQLEISRSNPAAVSALISTQPVPSGVGANELSAWIMVARTLLNLDEFIVRE